MGEEVICDSCKILFTKEKKFEIIDDMNEEPRDECPQCGEADEE